MRNVEINHPIGLRKRLSVTLDPVRSCSIQWAEADGNRWIRIQLGEMLSLFWSI